MKTFFFSVWYLDVLPAEDGLWEENNRFRLGEIRIRAEDIDCLTAKMFLKALCEFQVGTLFGKKQPAIDTVDRRRVYAEDYSGDGTWWEVGQVKGMKPIYGLKLEKEENYEIL